MATGVNQLGSLRLMLHGALRRFWSFQSEERFMNSRADLVHPGLQIVEILVQSGIDDFIYAGERKVGAKLAKQFFGSVAKGPGGSAGNAVKGIARRQQAEVNCSREFAIEQQKFDNAFRRD